jgi:hypothetical protein
MNIDSQMGRPTQHDTGPSWHGTFATAQSGTKTLNGHVGPPNVPLQWPRHDPKASQSCWAGLASTTGRQRPVPPWEACERRHGEATARGGWRGGAKRPEGRQLEVQRASGRRGGAGRPPVIRPGACEERRKREEAGGNHRLGRLRERKLKIRVEGENRVYDNLWAVNGPLSSLNLSRAGPRLVLRAKVAVQARPA